jgi:hypothetical protein
LHWSLAAADPLLLCRQLLVRQRSLAKSRVGYADRIIIFGKDIGGNADKMTLGGI